MTKEFGNAVRYSFMSEVPDEKYSDYIKQEPYGYVFEFSGKNLTSVTPDEDELGSFLQKLVKTKNLPPNLARIVQTIPQQLRVKLQQPEIDFQTTAIAGKWVVNNISDATMQHLLKRYHNVVNYASINPVAVWVIPKPNERFLRDPQGTFNTYKGYVNYAKRFGKRHDLSTEKQGVAEGRTDELELEVQHWREQVKKLQNNPRALSNAEKNLAKAKEKLAQSQQGVAEGAEQQYLWHGSRQKIPVLEPRQSVDTGGAAGSNQNAIYATSDPKVAIAVGGLTTPDSDTAMFPNDPQMVLFSGKIRKGENVYLHKLPFNGPDGKPQFVQGAHDREFYSIPGVKGIKPVEIKAVPVNKYLNLIRQATPQDLELRKKNMKKQGMAEGSESTLWRLEKSEATGRYYVVKGYNKSRRVWKNKMGLGDFISKETAQKKVDELNQGVAEAFDKPYKGKWEKSEYGDQNMLVKLPDGTNLSIMFNHEGDDEWQVEFHRDNSQLVTGQGDQQRIFATVIAAIQKFIKKQKPWRIIFSASKDVEPGQNSESRARLYNSLVARYARAWGYEEYNEDHGDQVTYELTRIANEASLNELTYKKNIGAMETFKFYSVATPEQKAELKRLLAKKKYRLAWDLVQQVTGTKLQGLGTPGITEDNLDEVLGFLPNKPQAKQPKATLAQMRDEFKKYPQTPPANIKQDKHPDEQRSKVYTKYADEGVTKGKQK